MQIDQLTIKNFNGFEHREFKFNSHFNLLVGDNAAGKTSVLDALAVSVGSWVLGIRGFEKSPGIGAEEVRVAAYRHLDSCTFEKQFPARIECSGLVMGKTVSWVRELQREGGRTTSVDAKAVSEGDARARLCGEIPHEGHPEVEEMEKRSIGVMRAKRGQLSNSKGRNW